MSHPRRTGWLMIWGAAIGGLLLLTWMFSSLIDQRQNPNRVVESRAYNGLTEVRLAADRQGHYVAPGQINGQQVTFLVDTGATLVSIPESLADELGLVRMASIRLQTAAGPVNGWITHLDEVRLGDIQLHNVRGAINPGRHDTVLLGMSFLGDLELTHRDGELVVRSGS